MQKMNNNANDVNNARKKKRKKSKGRMRCNGRRCVLAREARANSNTNATIFTRAHSLTYSRTRAQCVRTARYPLSNWPDRIQRIYEIYMGERERERLDEKPEVYLDTLLFVAPTFVLPPFFHHLLLLHLLHLRFPRPFRHREGTYHMKANPRGAVP